MLSFWAVPGLTQRLVVSVFPVTLAGEGLGARFCREATWDLERAGRWLAVMRLARSGRNLASSSLTSDFGRERIALFPAPCPVS